MIQSTRDNDQALTTNNIYADLYDVMTAITFNPLIVFTNQTTNKSVNFIAKTFITTNKERYMKLTYDISNDGTTNTTSGVISIGDDDFPYGFYNVTIYQNNDGTNLDTDNAIKVIYKTVMNFKAVNNNAVTYTEYTTNDTETDSVYITNTV